MLKSFLTPCSLPVESVLITTPLINAPGPKSLRVGKTRTLDVGSNGVGEHLFNWLSTAIFRATKGKNGVINESTALITITITLISIYLFFSDVSSRKNVVRVIYNSVAHGLNDRGEWQR